MAHDLDFSTGKPAIAYVGEEPWHGFGHKLPDDASIETWVQAAGLGWEILREPVRYQFKGELREVPDRHVLLRSDTGSPLSVVSDSYCIVQPREAVEFYRDIIDGTDFALETAGALDGGRKIWGLARSIHSSNDLLGDDDKMEPYLLLASSCDKSLATTVSFVSVRVVCQNTLSFAMESIKGKSPSKVFKVTHDKRFDWQEAKVKLALINTAWEDFLKKVNSLSQQKAEGDVIDKFFERLFLTGKKDNETLSQKAILEIQRLKSARLNGIGQQLPSTQDTAWGLVNAVTYYVDHQRKSNDQTARLDSAWFGSGAALKDKAWDTAIEMFGIAV